MRSPSDTTSSTPTPQHPAIDPHTLSAPLPWLFCALSWKAGAKIHFKLPAAVARMGKFFVHQVEFAPFQAPPGYPKGQNLISRRYRQDDQVELELGNCEGQNGQCTGQEMPFGKLRATHLLGALNPLDPEAIAHALAVSPSST